MILKFTDFQPNLAYFAYIIQKLIIFYLTKVLTELLRQKYKKIKKIEIPRPTHSQSSEMQISSVKLCKKRFFQRVARVEKRWLLKQILAIYDFFHLLSLPPILVGGCRADTECSLLFPCFAQLPNIKEICKHFLIFLIFLLFTFFFFF